MKETTVKMNKTKRWFYEKILKKRKRKRKPQLNSSRIKVRKIKLTKLELKKDRLQQTMKKYKRS